MSQKEHEPVSRVDGQPTREHGIDDVREQWQPIETAEPEDGDSALLYWHDAALPDDYSMVTGVYLAFENAPDCQSGWYDDAQSILLFPTHWMPLPNPPHEAKP